MFFTYKCYHIFRVYYEPVVNEFTFKGKKIKPQKSHEKYEILWGNWIFLSSVQKIHL